MLSVRAVSVCPVCLSVCYVRALWPNVWTDQDETWHAGIGLGPGGVLDGDPASPLPKRHSLHPIFGPYLLRPNGCNRCMYQDATWYGDRPQPRQLCVRWGPRYPPQKGGRTPPQFSAHFYSDQDGDNFRPMFIIVFVISLEHCTLSLQSSSSFITLCILFLEKNV